MKKHLILALTALVVAFAGCSDDEVEEPFLRENGLANIENKNYTITGFGCGVDITGTIGQAKGEQILDLERLYKERAIELDATPSLCQVYRTGNDYTDMTKQINALLANDKALDNVTMPFGRHLNDALLEGEMKEFDIYEYGVYLAINKQYALGIKTSFHDRLKEYVKEEVWREIDATDADNRTDIPSILALYDKYGTHIVAKAFYGGMYQLTLAREQNLWESKMAMQLELARNSHFGVPHIGFITSGATTEKVSYVDQDCYQQAPMMTVEHRTGGKLSLVNPYEWLESAKAEDPATCAFLGYSLQLDGSREDGVLIPLYELLDDGDARKNAMKEALEKYVFKNEIGLEERSIVVVDAFGRHFADGSAPEYLYEKRNGTTFKYFRLDEEMLGHVVGVTKGTFYFYYALGHLTGEAVVEMKFAESGDIDSDWETRGDHANTGVSGILRNRYLCIKTKNVKDGVSEDEFVTGFGVRVDDPIKATSLGTSAGNVWTQKGDGWFKGLAHDDVYCVYTKDPLKTYW